MATAWTIAFAQEQNRCPVKGILIRNATKPAAAQIAAELAYLREVETK